MSASSSSGAGGVVVGSEVRDLAEALAALFVADRQLAAELNAAQRRLLDANDLLRLDLLRLGVSPDALRTRLGLGSVNERGGWGAVLESIADTIRRALCDYQSAAEQRRKIGADVGEATARLIDAMAACGFSEAQTRGADVWALRDGTYRPGNGEG